MNILGDTWTSGQSAVLSDDGLYRYALGRNWNTHGDTWLPIQVWIMLNPSTADARLDDPTIRKVIGFSRRFGCGGAVVVNLYGLRSTKPSALHAVANPVGPRNNQAIVDALKLAAEQRKAPIAAWGSFDGPNIYARVNFVREQATALGLRLRALRLSRKTQNPEHPLYIPYDINPVQYA